MLSFAIIVFREALEIALVLSVLLAGTRGLSRRGRWISLGIGLGLLGSTAVALSADKIAASVEGLGQEIFNASVLLLAAVLITSTLLWMKSHSKQICANLKQLGNDIVTGNKPLSMLAIVIALSVLRDGAEVVLLAHGVMATGQSISQILLGSILGIAGGVIVGMGIYYGIIKAATKQIFAVTSWMLIILSAGMVSQAIGFLSAAGVVPDLIYPVWDTSAILSERSYLGQTLNVLIGYTARPSGMQILAYLTTILLIVGALKIVSEGLKPKHALIAATYLAVISLFVFNQNAYAADKIYSPNVELGELELETRGTFGIDSKDEKNDAYKQRFGVGYGFTDRYAAEIELILEREPNEDTEFEAVEFENRFQFAEPGEYWLDSGLYLALEWKPEDDEYELESRILLEKSIDRIVTTSNIEIKHELFESSEFEGEVSIGSRYRYIPEFEPGVEAHFEIGELDDVAPIDEQDWSVGPMFHGSVKQVSYVLATLFGVTDGATDVTLRWELEYEW